MYPHTMLRLTASMTFMHKVVNIRSEVSAPVANST